MPARSIFYDILTLLFLSRVLGKELVLPLPQVDSDLIEYIKDIQEFLTYRIEILDDGLSKRKTYLEAFMVEFER